MAVTATIQPMGLPDDLLLRPAAEATRRIALDLLDQATAASARLDDPEDREALHDFRVAVRRLRSSARAHRRHLGDVLTKKRRDQLKEVQRRTGGARDTEVQLEHVEALARAIDREEALPGIAALVAKLEAAMASASSKGVKKARKRFAKLEEKLRDPLGRVTVSLVSEDATFGAVLGGLAREHVAELADLLAATHSVEDQKSLHTARIATKRLRYLLEPARGRAPRAREISKRCKRLQDILGDIQDMHVLQETLKEAAGEASPEQLPGILALEKATDDELERAFDELMSEYLGDQLDAMVDSVEWFARGLDGQRQTETERKYLLGQLPPFLGEGAAVPDSGQKVGSKELRQGYLPGNKLRERLREIRSGKRVSYLRTIKGGSGMQRIEVEEEASPEVFEQMWPLTEGARVHKRRYSVPDGALVWVVDEFLDRELVLAEVELPSLDVRPPIPTWMAPHLVRDVTGEDEYVNLNLAR